MIDDVRELNVDYCVRSLAHKVEIANDLNVDIESVGTVMMAPERHCRVGAARAACSAIR